VSVLLAMAVCLLWPLVQLLLCLLAPHALLETVPQPAVGCMLQCGWWPVLLEPASWLPAGALPAAALVLLLPCCSWRQLLHWC
jgi:hypothetical protein